MNVFYVYEHWRTDRDECFYVGKGKGKRAYNMSLRNPHHKAVQNKVIREGFAIEVKIVASGLTEDAAFKLEMERIAFWRNAKIDLTNITNGGEGASGYVVSEENRRKMSQRLKGKPLSEEQKQKISKSLQGHTVSEYSRQKQSNSMKKSHTPERAEKLRKHAISNINMFKKYQIMGPKSSAKKVICVDDNLEFESASAAARHYNTAKSAIIELCLGKKNRKTVLGKVFKYVEEV